MEHFEREHERGERTRLEEITKDVIAFATATKQRMLTKGVRSGKRRCPREGCGGLISATLNGSRDHIHMKCSVPECYMSLIE